MRFREVGKALVVELEDRQAVIGYLREQFAEWPTIPDPVGIDCEYSHESAPTNAGGPGWGKVYVVTLPGYGVVGFADAPL